MNVPHHICPQCGYDITIDTPIIIDNFSMFGAGYPLCYDGKPLAGLSAQEEGLCWALIKAFPRHLRYDVLLDRLDSEGSINTLHVHVSRMRGKLAEFGLALPIITVRGRGYIWGYKDVAVDIALKAS